MGALPTNRGLGASQLEEFYSCILN